MGDAPCPVTATGCVPRDRQGAQAAGSAACPGKGPNFPERSMPIDEPRLNAFLGRALNDMGAAMSATLILIGDQLGLSKATKEDGRVGTAGVSKWRPRWASYN